MIMTTLKTLTIVAALLAGGTSLAIAQNGPATGGERPVAGGANGGGWGGGGDGTGWGGGAVMVLAGMVALPSTATATPTHACIATIGLTGTTGIGVTTKQWRR